MGVATHLSTSNGKFDKKFTNGRESHLDGILKEVGSVGAVFVDQIIAIGALNELGAVLFFGAEAFMRSQTSNSSQIPSNEANVWKGRM